MVAGTGGQAQVWMSRSIDGVLLDVNETLFALSGLAPAFEAAGVPAERMRLWFARVLRDGFALAASGSRPGGWRWWPRTRGTSTVPPGLACGPAS